MDPEIVVEGQREARRAALRELVEGTTRDPRREVPVERFLQPVCPLVYGLKPEYGDAIRDQVLANASDAGVEVAEAGNCKPNIYIVFAGDVEAEVRRLAEEDGELFEMLLDYQIERVLAEKGPVRAWNAAELRDERGRPMYYQKLFNEPSDRPTRMNKPGTASRMRLPVTMETLASIVVIDVSAMPGKSLRQLADYATMRVLAPTREIEDPAQAPFPTILTLFAGEEPPAGLTVFDRAYLRTLYNYPGTLRPDQMYQRIAMEADRAMEEGE